MKADQKQRRFAGLLMGFLCGLGGIGCIITGMRFGGVSMFPVAVFCLGAAIVAAAFTGRKPMPIIVGACFAAVLLLWKKAGLERSSEAFLNHISHLYHLGYGWGVIRWSAAPLSADMAQPIACLLGALLSFGTCWSFIRCKGLWVTALLICAPAVPCMVLTDTVPAAAYFFLQLLCLILLLLVRLARKQHQDSALMQLLALPVAAALLVLFLCIPQKSYASFPSVDALLGYVQEFFTDGSKETPQTPVLQEGSWENLSTVGPKTQSKTVVMDVTASRSGYLYLKGAAYDSYHGTWWDCRETAPAVPLPPTGSRFSVTVTTRAVHDILYLPYGTLFINNSEHSVSENRGQVANPDDWRSYTAAYQLLPQADSSWQIPSANMPDMSIQLPEATRRAATAYLNRELPQLQALSADAVWAKAQLITQHVSTGADYDLRTKKMPATRGDFALWFLEESDTGYCIHFASAATVLLRAADIPARYVTGYLVNARADDSVSVTQSNAHAWVECYIDGVGWVPLEPTPGNGLAETAGGEPTGASENHTAPQITESTAPSQSIETDEPTAPHLTTAPTQEITHIGGAQMPSTPAQKPTDPPSQKTPWLRWAVIVLCAIGAVIGQWRLRVLLWQQKRSRGKRNAQALTRWRQVTLHCRVRGCEPESRLRQLAQKARFSHHVITREELQEFDSWLTLSTAAVKQLSLWKRFLATVLLALY